MEYVYTETEQGPRNRPVQMVHRIHGRGRLPISGERMDLIANNAETTGYLFGKISSMCKNQFQVNQRQIRKQNCKVFKGSSK